MTEIFGPQTGWGDVEYNNGSAYTPFINQWTQDPHVITFQRGYSGSPSCSPTRSASYCIYSSICDFIRIKIQFATLLIL